MSASPLEIASPRLLLRPLAAADRGLYVRLYSDPAVMRHVAEPRPRAEVAAGFPGVLDLQHGETAFPPRWIAALRRTGKGVGLLGLVPDPGSDSAEAGIMLLPEAQRRGLAAEALAALAGAAFERGWARSLWARHAPANQAMARVLAGLGFEPDEVGDGDCRWRLQASRPENRPAGSGSPPSRLASSTPFG